MKNLLNLCGGHDDTFWRIVGVFEKDCIIRHVAIVDGKETSFFSFPDWNSYVAHREERKYKGYYLAVAGNDICAESALREMGYDAFACYVNGIEIITDKREEQNQVLRNKNIKERKGGN